MRDKEYEEYEDKSVCVCLRVYWRCLLYGTGVSSSESVCVCHGHVITYIIYRRIILNMLNSFEEASYSHSTSSNQVLV